MRGKATLAVAATTWMLLGASTAHAECADSDLRPTADNGPAVAEALFCLHNEERAESGLRPLRWSTLLARAASGHAEDMVSRGYFEHETPEGTTPSERMEEAGYGSDSFAWAGAENIAWASGELGTPGMTFERWMKSDFHRFNILDPDLRDVGFGIVFGAPKKGGPPEAVTYTVNFGQRDVADDDTVLTSPSGTPVAPPKPKPKPPAPPEPPPSTDDPPTTDQGATGKDRTKTKKRLRRCVRKARKRKHRPRARRRAVRHCRAKHRR